VLKAAYFRSLAVFLRFTLFPTIVRCPGPDPSALLRYELGAVYEYSYEAVLRWGAGGMSKAGLPFDGHVSVKITAEFEIVALEIQVCAGTLLFPPCK
jgi:hypothetical protein